jgi:DNA-binding NarL/FixJ family response regulator
MDDTRGIADAIMAGRMRLVSREDDGAGGSVLGFANVERGLTRRELTLLAAAEGGAANKLVAIEHCLACSTVSESLHATLGKLGFESRAEFVKVMAWLRAGSPDRGTRVVGGTELCWVVLPIEALDFDPRLTSAERQVVAGVLDGRSNAAIARARRTSSRTVANQLAAIYRKLGVSSRWELAARALRTSAPLAQAG